jgi:hypothetical protein
MLNVGGVAKSRASPPVNRALTAPLPGTPQISSKVYKEVWQFDKEGLPNDLIARGLAKRDAEGKVKLLLEDYPYADDGMLLWNAVESWVGDYLGLYYDDSVDAKKVINDKELQNWWGEIKGKVGPQPPSLDAAPDVSLPWLGVKSREGHVD